MSRYAKIVSTPTPQTEPLDTSQVVNNASGYVFALDQWARLDRFLILGSDAPTYYQKAKELTKENAVVVTACFDVDAERTAKRIAEISDSARAPKNDAAIFALAIGATSTKEAIRRAALAQLNTVCRTATHLFTFVDLCLKLKKGKGWGRMFKRAVANWYTQKPVPALAYQMIKYRERVGYTHKRLLQCAHPAAGSELARLALYRWARGLEAGSQEVAKALPVQVKAHLSAMLTTDKERGNLLTLIKEHGLPWEAIPTSVTKDPEVWKAMLPVMGLTALIRNLGGMTQYEALKPMEPEVTAVVEKLTSPLILAKARIHPFNVLLARAVYASGKSDRGSRKWQPIAQVTDALEKAYYESFKYVEPTGKRMLLGIDVSGSMRSPLMGSPLTVAEGAAAMAMTIARTEKNYLIMGFANTFRDLGITANMSLEEVLKKTTNQNFGSTDCALPMAYAYQKNIPVDCFCVLTDNETWSGHAHPMEMLRQYRQKTGINAKLIVCGMTSTNFSIADPNNGGCLDCIGFDSNVPSIISDFIRS